MITYAYNLLGIVEEAEDIVQDVLLKFSQVDQEKIADKKAYLIRMVINFSINRKKKLQREILQYPGEWLPEPVATDRADGNIARKDILSYSLMVLLEKLNPKERAVFILREAYDYEHSEIAKALEIGADHSRKLLSRAKAQLKGSAAVPVRYDAGQTLTRFMEVIQNRDMQKLEQILHDDILVTADGGGKASASRKMVSGKIPASLWLSSLHDIFKKWRLEISEINHMPALLYYDGNKLVNCEILAFENGRLSRVYFIRNPDKLKLLKKKPR